MTFPKDVIVKAVTTFHRVVFDVSKGKVAGTTGGMPVVKLTTIGRKAGEPRTTMLTTPLEEGDKVVLVASYGGDDRDPMWFSNLVAHPDVDVVLAGSKRKMRAVVAEGDERTRLWEALTAKHANYAGYQRKTSRQIPVVVLVDSNTASAAEIVTAALQDHRRATVVGTHTFGKGVFQEEEPLSNGGALDITVGEYFTPNGRNLGGGGVKQGAGIAPEVLVRHGVDSDRGLGVALSTLAAKVK